MNRLILTLIILVAGIQSTQAAVFNYSGTVTGGTGALATLVPVGSLIAGTFDIDSPDGAGTVTDPASILSIDLLLTSTVGNPLFCFNYNATCTAGTEVPITSILAVDLTFNANGDPVSGGISVLSFSPTFMIDLPIDLDITNGAFLVDGGVLGTSTGTGGFDIQPLPLPGAMWMLLSALFSMGLIKRSSH